jgi:hypothetical protein
LIQDQARTRNNDSNEPAGRRAASSSSITRRQYFGSREGYGLTYTSCQESRKLADSSAVWPLKWEWTKRQSALRSIEASFHEITTSSSA